MPSQNQSMMIDTIQVTTLDKGSSDTAKLKSAYGTHKDSVVKPGAKVTDFQTGRGDETVEVLLTREGIREAYEAHVKGDANSKHKYQAGSYWPEALSGASMVYALAPDLSKARTSDGEIAGGKDGKGSTIVATGLGPNVNVFGDLKDREVIDGSASPSSAKLDPFHATDGSASPHATSAKIAAEDALNPAPAGNSISGGG